jgi:hypothetical protein
MAPDQPPLILPEPEAEHFATDLINRILHLILESQGPLDISPERMREVFGLDFTQSEHGGYYCETKVNDHYRCSVSFYTFPNGDRRIVVSLDRLDRTRHGVRALVIDPDSNQVSAILQDAGFTETPLYGSHGARAGFEYTRNNFRVRVLTVGESRDNAAHKCVDLVSLRWFPSA